LRQTGSNRGERVVPLLLRSFAAQQIRNSNEVMTADTVDTQFRSFDAGQMRNMVDGLQFATLTPTLAMNGGLPIRQQVCGHRL
jgi:hypothetical protein